MKFIRHLVAASAVVFAISLIGIGWGHTGLKSLVADGGRGFHDRSPGFVESLNSGQSTGVPVGAPPNGFRDHGGRDFGRDNNFSSRLVDLGQTIFTFVVIAGTIIVVDGRMKKRRLSKRIRVA